MNQEKKAELVKELRAVAKAPTSMPTWRIKAALTDAADALEGDK